MKQIIESIQNQLQREVKALKYIDQDWGQMDYYDQPPVKLPAALIDIQSAQYSNIGQLVQQATATILIRIYDYRLSNSSQAAPASQKANAQKNWQLIQDINRALHGQAIFPVGYGTLCREQMRRTKSDAGYYIIDISYSLQLRDDSCQQKLVATTANPTISVSISK